MKTKAITVFSPGTCGELIQGKMSGVNFLVTSPINLFSKIIIKRDKISAPSFDHLHLKSKKALNLFFELFDIKDRNLSIQIDSKIPKGKGMASSSADISGILYALSRIYDISLSPIDIAKISVNIEPTDGIMFPGIVLFDYIKATKWEHIGKPFPLKVLVVDFGGEIDTVKFNKNGPSGSKNFPLLLHELKKAFKERDIKLFGNVITKSTLENQRTIFKHDCEALIEKALSLGAIGVNTAHSGTVCGIFTPFSKREKVDKIRTMFPHLTFLGWYSLIGGGFLVEM